MSLKTDLRDFARHEGASLVGIAPVDRFAGAPRGHAPRDLLARAESVIVVGIKIPDPLVEYTEFAQKFQGRPFWAESTVAADDWLRATTWGTYMQMGVYTVNIMLNQLAVKMALKLEGEGYGSLPTPNTGNTGLGLNVTHTTNFFAVFSQRHAAVRAGLGEFGINNIVLTPQFGPRVRFVSVITEAKLDPDPLLQKPVCLREKCDLKQGPRCIKACPGAIQLIEGKDQKPLFLNTPSRTDARVCQRALGDKSALPLWACKEYGACMRVCPLRRPGPRTPKK